jgi:hypothetical protein
MIPHLQVGLHHKLAKKKDTEMCVYLSGEVWEATIMGDLISLTFGKNSLGFNNWSFGIIWELLRGLGW